MGPVLMCPSGRMAPGPSDYLRGLMKSLLTGIAVALSAAALASSAHAITSQGVFRMGADALWARGIDGTGLSVAVLDPGFGGLSASIAAGELPPMATMATRSFDVVHGLEGRDNLGVRTEHGTRMAEIVHDVAPGARLVLVNYGSIDEFVQATEWIAANGIAVVSHSNSLLVGPFDGTGTLARAVDAAVARGVLWVNSAGNFGQRHWRGIPIPEGTAIPIAPSPGTTLAFGVGWATLGSGATLSVQRQQPDGLWEEVTRSDSTGRTPLVGVDGGVWRLVVIRTGGTDASVDVFSRTVGFGDAAVVEGGIPTPGDAAGSLSVGAVPWSSSQPEPYSSRGPTQDGRQKPELVGPTYVTANAAYPGTAGTSAATAHVAGAAVLVHQERARAGQPVDVAAVRADLVARSRDLGAPGPDMATGWGMVRVDVVPPRSHAWVRRGRRPLVTVRVHDDGTMQSVELRINGRRVRTTTGPQIAMRVSLTVGVNRIEVHAIDAAGNASTYRRTVRR